MSRRGSPCDSTRSLSRIRLVRQIVQQLPAGRSSRADVRARRRRPGASVSIEGWRGPVLVALEAGDGGKIRRCHPHDPSWQNWPVLEHAIIDNIVPDFPLINKSFNLSYSGHDLARRRHVENATTDSSRGNRHRAAAIDGRSPACRSSGCRRAFSRCSVAHCAFAPSTRVPATAASWRSMRSATHSTISKVWASASSPARGTPTCCWSPGLSPEHGSRAATDLRRDAGSEAGRRGRRLWLHAEESSARATRAGSRIERHTGGRDRAGLPAESPTDSCRHSDGDFRTGGRRLSVARGCLSTPSTEVISMRIERQRTSPFPALLLEPNLANAAQLASRLQAAGFEIRIEGRVDSALQAQRRSFFFALIVIADLADQDCLVTLDTLRRRSPRSWMIVATSKCDDSACNVIHRYGGDACISLPIDLDDLIARLDAFALRARPSF